MVELWKIMLFFIISFSNYSPFDQPVSHTYRHIDRSIHPYNYYCSQSAYQFLPPPFHLSWSSSIPKGYLWIIWQGPTRNYSRFVWYRFKSPLSLTREYCGTSEMSLGSSQTIQYSSHWISNKLPVLTKVEYKRRASVSYLSWTNPGGSERTLFAGDILAYTFL